jgi:predicted ATPase
MSIQEKLIIKNFFTITDFEWDIKGFNVLTGSMASGKSLALKLLYFCEQVFQQTIFDTTINRELFQKEIFFKKINENFNTIFVSKDHKSDYFNTEINYSYVLYKSLLESSKNQSEQLLLDPEVGLPIITVFDLSATWDKTELRWSSKYIESKLQTWQTFFDEQNTPELVERVRNRVFESISSDFSNSFPLAAMFIPASRAIAAITSNIWSRDRFIQEFMSLKEFALAFNELGGISSEAVNTILQFQSISLENGKDKQPVFQLLNGRNISSLELSSGQQELLYLLLLIEDLKRTKFTYGNHASIFIEEPSAHLFPKEQKETVEFLVASFNELQKRKSNYPGHRFFISTHSPYLLNTINNLMEKDRLLKKVENISDSIIKNTINKKIDALSFPCLSIDYVSAYMIEKEGYVKTMINNIDDEPYIYSEVIDQISQEITEGTETLYNINNEIKNTIQSTERTNK